MYFSGLPVERLRRCWIRHQRVWRQPPGKIRPFFWTVRDDPGPLGVVAAAYLGHGSAAKRPSIAGHPDGVGRGWTGFGWPAASATGFAATSSGHSLLACGGRERGLLFPDGGAGPFGLDDSFSGLAPGQHNLTQSIPGSRSSGSLRQPILPCTTASRRLSSHSTPWPAPLSMRECVPASPDLLAREPTIILYLDKKAFHEALQLPGEETG
jgi:hypothetical protein